MSVACEGCRIAHTKMAGATFKRVTKCQRAKGRVSSSAATGDYQSRAINLTTLHQVARAIHTIIYINDTPFIFQAIPILSAISGAAAIVDIQDSKASAGPILNGQTLRRCHRRSWSTVTLNDQRRQLVARGLVVRILRLIEERVRGQTLLGRKLNRARNRKVRRIKIEIVRPTQCFKSSRVDLQSNDCGRGGW